MQPLPGRVRVQRLEMELDVGSREPRPPAPRRSGRGAYRGRYAALKDAVTETEPTFRDDLLGEQSVIELLTTPVNVLADSWRSADGG